MARRYLLTVAVSAVALQLAGCGFGLPTEAPYFDPRVLQRSERAQSRLEIPPDMPPMPTTQIDPLGGEGNEEAGTTRPSDADITYGPTTGPSLDEDATVRLSLQDAVQRAVLYNHDVKVAGYQPAIDASRIVEAAGTFDPVLFTNAQASVKDDQTAGELFTNPANQQLTNPTFRDNEDVYSVVTGVKQNLTSGGQVQLDYNTSYNYLFPQRFTDNPFYQNKIELQLTQPLLRDFGADVNEARLFISRNDARVSLLEFRKALEENVAKTEEAYWQLVQATQNVGVEESLLREDERSYQLQYSRLRQKLISSLEVSQVQSSLESRRAALIRAKADARNFSDQLKQLMNDPNLPVASPVLIVPADQPVVQPMRFDAQDEINSGMENRFELGEQLLKIDTATLTYGVAKNNTLPKLNFVGSATPNVINSNYGDALTDQAKFGNFEYTAGLEFEFPIGNREALAILRRTALQRQQAIEQYSALISQVALDVRQAAREVETTYKLILTNRQARFAAQRALADEVERQENGTDPLTPDFVQLRLDLTDRSGQAQEAENLAISNYNIALERLERAKGTLLKYNNVVMQEEPYRNEGWLR
jgi:outer membrane protein